MSRLVVALALSSRQFRSSTHAAPRPCSDWTPPRPRCASASLPVVQCERYQAICSCQQREGVPSVTPPHPTRSDAHRRRACRHPLWGHALHAGLGLLEFCRHTRFFRGRAGTSPRPPPRWLTRVFDDPRRAGGFVSACSGPAPWRASTAVCSCPNVPARAVPSCSTRPHCHGGPVTALARTR